MRISFFSIVASLACGASLLQAQEKVHPAPAPPFVRNAPSHAAWTIEHQKPGAAKTPSPSAKAFLKKTEVVKFGPTRREIDEWSDGARVERWFYQGCHVFEQRGAQDVYVVNSSADAFQRLTYPDYSQNDFPEFEWLSVETYVGDKPLHGTSAQLFQKPLAAISGPVAAQIQAATGADIPKIATPEARLLKVWIDPQSRLPLAVENRSKTKVYTFRDAPSSEPPLPARFLGALQNYRNSRAASQKR